jgi:predicted porin
MSKIVKLSVAAAVSVASSVACAQSSVTLYGLIDEGVMYQSNVGGSKKISLDSLSGMNGSRWGLTGAEDLGGGLRAIFTMESGVNLNNGTFGQGGTPWGRQIFVGLNSSRYGSLTFGRQYDMLLYFVENTNMAGRVGSAVFIHPGDVDNTGNTVRVNNAIRYVSPEFYGFSFGGEYSVGGTPGDTTANSGYSLGMQYVFGTLRLGAAFEYFKDPVSSTAGSGFFTDNSGGSSSLSQSLNKGYATAKAYQVAIVGAAYTLASTTFNVSLSRSEYANLGATFNNGAAKFTDVDVGVTYNYSPAWIFAAGYNYLTSQGVDITSTRRVGNQHYNQVGLMADYLLSKRTDINLIAGWQRAVGTNSTGAPAVADISYLGDSSNNHQVLIRAALRHRF